MIIPPKIFKFVISSRNSIVKNKAASIANIATEIKEIIYAKSINPAVLKLEEEMKKMGYNVTFADNIDTGKAIIEVYKRFSNAGIQLPENIVLFTSDRKNLWGLRPYVPKNKDPLKTPIYFNKDIGLCKNPKYVIYHEIGHFLHEKTSLQPEIARNVWSEMTKNGMDTDLLFEAGEYAMKGDILGKGREFVAEVFAGMLTGKRYSQKVMNVYNALRGPKIAGMTNDGLSRKINYAILNNILIKPQKKLFIDHLMTSQNKKLLNMLSSSIYTKK